MQQLGRRGYYVAQFMNVHPRAVVPDDGNARIPHDGIQITQTMPDRTCARR
jgi:hypothetical protein